MFFYFLCVLLGFPQGFLPFVISHRSLLKEKNMGLRFRSSLCVSSYVQNLINLSLFTQSMGCPKRLTKTLPDQFSLKRSLHLKTLMHTHTHAYLLSYDRSRIVLGDGQIPSQIQRQRQIEVSGNAATICCAMSFPAFWYSGTDASRG